MEHIAYIFAALVAVVAGQTEPICGGKPAEIFFLLDSSSSVWRKDFDKQREFVASVVDKFVIAENRTRVGLGVFSTYYRRWFALNRYYDKEVMKGAIMRVPYLTGDTMTHEALRYMRERGFNPEVVRKDVVRIGILLTDGKSRDTTKTLLEAKRLKDDGVVMMAIGIGNKTDLQELKGVASNDTLVFEVAGFDALKTLQTELAFKACEAESPQRDAPGCGLVKKADVMFVYDAGTLGSSKVEAINYFIEHAVRDFNMDSGIIRSGILTTNCYRGDVKLEDHGDKQGFINQIRKNNQDIPDLSEIIRRLRLHSFSPENGGRPKCRKMAVVFLDDAFRKPEKLFDEINRAKFSDIEVFVVAVGDQYKDSQLKNMASTPPEKHIIKFESFKDLKEKINESRSEFIQVFCDGKPQATQSPISRLLETKTMPVTTTSYRVVRKPNVEPITKIGPSLSSTFGSNGSSALFHRHFGSTFLFSLCILWLLEMTFTHGVVI